MCIKLYHFHTPAITIINYNYNNLEIKIIENTACIIALKYKFKWILFN
jgi:hypothetical protein